MARGQRDPDLERQWRERVAGWTASGLSVRAFCLQHGLIETSFYYWKRELQVRDAAAVIAPAKLPAAKFVPVTVLAGSTLSVEVRCPSGHVVLLPACEVASLASLLVALAATEREPQSC